MTKSSKSPEYVSWIALGLSLIFFCVSFFVGRWSRCPAVYAVSWQLLAAALVWFVLLLQFYLRSLAERERLDMTHLRAEGEGSTIFHAGGERAELLAVAQQRLNIFEKWFIPGFAILIAAYQIGIAWYLWRPTGAVDEIKLQYPQITAVVMAAIAFVSFLISRYATGMSAETAWKPLRGGGSVLLATAMTCFAVAITLGWGLFQSFWWLNLFVWIIPILLALLGVETLLNVIFDIYRPRITGQYSRAPYDSRILGTFNEPGGLLHSAASAMDYQFGFKVSQTWFFKLMEKAIVPLILFGALILYLFSCMVIVEPGEQAVVERFGRPLEGFLKPGLAVKWPWPIDRVFRVDTEKVRELYIGYIPEINKETGELIRKPLLWGAEHHEEEFSVLVASATQTEETTEEAMAGALPMSLVKANIPVHYKIKDVHDFIYNHSDPETFLEAICYHELAKFAASATIEVDSEAALQTSLLGAGRSRAKAELTRRVQEAADDAGLGLELVFLGLQGIHPPPEVAKDYQNVIGAVQEQQAKILDAQRLRNEYLTTLVGSVKDAYDLYDLARQYQEAQSRKAPVDDLERALDEGFVRAQGEIYHRLRQSLAYAFQKKVLAKGRGDRFVGQIQAFQAAPEIYLHRQRLEALEVALGPIRKYAIVSDPNDRRVTIIDVQEKLMPDLYEALGETNER
jgi:modulator of FtsH protease HflK